MAEAPVFDIDEFLKATSRTGASAPAPAAAVTPTEIMGPPRPGRLTRMGAKVPTLTRGLRGTRSLLARGARTLPVVGTIAAAGIEAANVADVAENPNATGFDVATAGAESVSRLASAAAGTGLGFAGGGPIGAAIGGTVGYFAPDAVFRLRDAFTGRRPPAAPQAPAPIPRIANAPPAAAAEAPPAETRGAIPAPQLDPAAILDRSIAAPRGMGAIQASGAPARLIGGTGPEVTLPPVRYQPRTSVGSFFQAGADMKVMANTQAAGERQEKLLLDAITKAPAARKAALEARLLGTRAAAVDAMVNAGIDPSDIARATTGGDVSPRFSVPPGAILTPGQPVPVISNRSGEVELRTPRTRASLGQGSDGKTYVLDAQGKPVRPATPSELAQLRK